MSTQNPNIRETLDNGVLQQIADIFATLKAGRLFSGIVEHALGPSLQVVTVTLSAGANALTFAGLGLTAPRDANYEVLAVEDDGNSFAAVTSKTAAGFTLTPSTGTPSAKILVWGGSQFQEHPTVTSRAATLSARPDAILDVVGLAGSVGRKVLKIADSSYSPVAGEVVWDGNLSLRFGDAVTSVKVLLAPSGTFSELSMLARILGTRD